MMYNNPNVDLVNMNAYIRFGEILSICPQDILPETKEHNYGTNVRKMICNNPKLDLVNINVYIKFGELVPICSQDIEQKRHFRLNQGR